MIEPEDVPIVTAIAEMAMTRSWGEYAAGMVASEDRLTEAVAARMRDSVPAVILPSGHVFGIRALQSSAGPVATSEETRYGADILVTLDVRTDRLRLCLGWIAQAKIRKGLKTRDLRRLQKQCRDMEREMPGNGWVVLYGERTKVLRGNQVASMATVQIGTLPSRAWRTHFRRFFLGEFGDSRACELLASEFVARRRSDFGLPPVVLTLFYGDETELPEWRGSGSQELQSLRTPSPAGEADHLP